MKDTMSNAVIQTISTPDGPFIVLEDIQGRVLSSGWTDSKESILSLVATQNRPRRIIEGQVSSADAVHAFYTGQVDQILKVPVHQYGTELFQEGWRQLRLIPAGSTLSYAELAAAMGRPTAVRVAASVCARNAVALFIPCHRVVRSDGTLGGFGWGLDVKRSVLKRESGFDKY